MAGLRQLTEREVALIGRFAQQHGTVRGLDMPIADDRGDVSSPLIRLSTLARLEERGAISQQEAAAGSRFYELFQHAALDGLRAADMGRIPTAAGAVPGEISPSNERCRHRIAEAVAALGGNGSVAASVIWHCVGLEWSVRRWSVSARRSNGEGCGILCAALSTLAGHFARRK